MVAALFVGRARDLGILGLVLLTGCGGNARKLDGASVGAGGSLSSAAGAQPSASGSSAGGSSGIAGSGASSAGNAAVGGAAQAGFPGIAGSPGTASGAAGTAAGNTGGATASGAGASGAGASGAGASGAGASGASGVDIGPAAKVACSSVCSKFNTANCATIGDLGPTCQSDCGSSFAIQSGACTELGLEMMSCITLTTPSPSFSDCWIRFYDVTQQCYLEVNAYKKCVASVGAGPLPAALCAQISQVGSGDPSSGATLAHCYEDRKCLNGLNYKVDCYDTIDKQSSCSCEVRDRAISDFVWLDSTLHACKDALPNCLAAAAALAPGAP